MSSEERKKRIARFGKEEYDWLTVLGNFENDCGEEYVLFESEHWKTLSEEEREHFVGEKHLVNTIRYFIAGDETDWELYTYDPNKKHMCQSFSLSVDEVYKIHDILGEKEHRDKPVGERLRFMVLNRDKFTCKYCGRKAPQVGLQVDHILALSKGGKSTIDNLVTACDECNLGKSNSILL